MPRICQAYIGEVWNEYDGRTHIFPQTPDQTNKEKISITQSKYTRELLKKFRMESSKIVSTSMTPSYKLEKDEHDKSVDTKLYRDMIGSLLYLTTSRPDIMFSVCICARYQSNSKESYLITLKYC